jgi:ComF family protein
VNPFVSLALELLASALAPPRCAACDIPVRMLAAFCPACASTHERAESSAASLAACVYGGAVARAITRCKYERRPDLARPLGDLLWRAVEPYAGAMSGALVVPVPLHPARLAERGFNQSALLAGRVARSLGAPMAPRALARTTDTAHQANLDRAARLANVSAAFRVRHPAAVRGRLVLLVDDVRTTGATLDACRSVLAGAGASRIVSAVVAVAVASTPAR